MPRKWFTPTSSFGDKTAATHAAKLREQLRAIETGAQPVRDKRAEEPLPEHDHPLPEHDHPLEQHSHPEKGPLTYEQLSDIVALLGSVYTENTAGKRTVLDPGGLSFHGPYGGGRVARVDQRSASPPRVDLVGDGGSDFLFFTSLGKMMVFHNGVSEMGLGIHGNSGRWGIDLGATAFVRFTLADGTSELRCIKGDNSAFHPIAASAFRTASDRRFKHNIKTLPNGLSRVRRLRGTTFKDASQTDDEPVSDKPRMGLIGQEVAEVFPEAVDGGDLGEGTEHHRVEYDALIAPLIEAVKELADRLEKVERALAPPSSLTTAVR